jgi:lysophospholipase L1-like esterase
MNRKLTSAALALAMGWWGAAALVRADEPKKPQQQTSSKPAEAKDEPTVPSIKGANNPKNGFLKRHEKFLEDKEALLKKGPIQLVFIGDSITDFWRSRGKDVFEKNYAQYNTYNIGISGDRTQHVLWRIDNGELDGITPNPKVAQIMIGTNNLKPNPSNEEIAAGVTKIVKEVHEKLPQTKILLLAIFPRGEEPTNPYRARIKAINEMIAKLDDGGKTVKYLDIGDKFLEPDGTLPKSVMPDSLHPNAKGYEIWAEAIRPTLEEMMK